MIRTSWLTTFGALLLAACGGSTGSGSSQGCEQNGKVYDIGESFGDGCNTCQCTEQGIACTAMACPPPTCTYGGKEYAAGESFPAGDGCNTCSCSSDGNVACTLMACVPGCTYDGKSYEPGQTFPAGDGCNTCTCQDGGNVICTKMACQATCVYGGKTYTSGQTFPSLDGCNTCTCAGDGSVGCTEIACPCDPGKEWWRSYVATSPEQCMVIDYTCPENTTPFSNTCGCGCEQSAECPQYFDCMPPAACNVDELKKKCPYSGIAY